MFSQKPKLPLDLQLGLQMEKQNTKSHSEFVAQLENRIGWAHELARVTQTVKWSVIKNGMTRGCSAPA